MRRVHAHGVIYREIPEEKRIVTVYGIQETISKHCPACEEFLPLSSFYLRSKSKRKKNKNTVEKICCVCFDKRRKKNRQLKKNKPSVSITLFEFI